MAYTPEQLGQLARGRSPAWRRSVVPRFSPAVRPPKPMMLVAYERGLVHGAILASVIWAAVVVWGMS